MTLHGAKGLEARVVFLAEPAGDNYSSRNFWVDREGEIPVGYFRIVQKLGKRGEQDLAVPPGWDAMCEAEEAFEARSTFASSTSARRAPKRCSS